MHTTAVNGRLEGLSGYIEVKWCAVGQLSRRDKPGAQRRRDVEHCGRELERITRNARCSGEMHRNRAELRLRRQHTGSILTLRHESAGIEQD